LTLATYKSTRAFPNDERFGLTSQMRRSASSIPVNLAEGCGRRSDGELGRDVQIAMGPGAELSYHLLLTRDLEFLVDSDFESLSLELNEIMRMLFALSTRLRKGWRGVTLSS
jgi:four helix bundle protein